MGSSEVAPPMTNHEHRDHVGKKKKNAIAPCSQREINKREVIINGGGSDT